MTKKTLFIERWLVDQGIYCASDDPREQLEILFLVREAWGHDRLVVSFRLPSDTWRDRWESGDAQSGIAN